MTLILATLLLASDPGAAVPIDDLVDIDGRAHDLTGRPTVVVFTKTTCPIANYYQPTLRTLAERWGDRVPLVIVQTESKRTLDELRAHRDEYNVAGLIVHDPDGQWVEMLDAKVTPEAFVLGASGAVQYRGRIDDTYLGFGKRRQAATEHDLANAVEAVLSGQTPTITHTKAVGCVIRRKK